jgi:hypothetical protein
MEKNEPREDEAGIGDLVKTAIDDVQELAKIEIALAKQEVRHDIMRLKGAAIAFGAAAAGVLMAFAMALVAIVLAVGASPGAALAMAAILVGGSIIAGAVGYRLIPRAPGPEKTAKHAQAQARILKERIA